MSTVEHERDEIAEAAANNGGSLLDQVRAQRRKLQEERWIDLDVPGYDGMLVVRYKPLPWDQVKKVGEKMLKSKRPDKELMAQCDVLINACDSIWFRDDNGRLKPPRSDVDEAIKYDDLLVEVLDLGRVNSAREIVRRTFSNDLAIASHHAELVEWMESSDREVDEEIAGE